MTTKRGAVVCFIADGSPKYTPMLLTAIESVLRTTPDVRIGIITVGSAPLPDFFQIFGDQDAARFDVRPSSPHFDNWNPTQYKLDIAQFAKNYEVVAWLDSDAVASSSLQPSIDAFLASGARVGLVEDLVTTKPDFKQHWATATGSGTTQPFVPQAAFMLWTETGVNTIFPVWEQLWRQWITPEPFAGQFKDPDPTFHDSAFCIEQYALGLALEHLELLDQSSVRGGPVHFLMRRQLLLSAGTSTGAFAAGDALESSAPSLSQATHAPAAHVSVFTNPAVPAPVTATHGGLSSYRSSWSSWSSWSSSWGSSGQAMFGAGKLRSVGDNVQLGSLPQVAATPGFRSDGPLSGGGGGGGGAGSASTGGHVGAADFISVVQVVSPHRGERGTDCVVDSFAGCVLHFYSANYAVGHALWLANKPLISDALKHLWRK